MNIKKNKGLVDTDVDLNVLLEKPLTDRSLTIQQVRDMLSIYASGMKELKTKKDIIAAIGLHIGKSIFTVGQLLTEFREAARQNFTLEGYFAEGRPFKSSAKYKKNREEKLA